MKFYKNNLKTVETFYVNVHGFGVRGHEGELLCPVWDLYFIHRPAGNFKTVFAQNTTPNFSASAPKFQTVIWWYNYNYKTPMMIL